MTSKLRKLYRDPVAYCLDSRHKFLRVLGARALEKQTERYAALGAANSHRKITVIMTAFNTVDLVADAVRSVLAQTHQNLELMVIDDASTDDTLDTLKRLAADDERVKLYHSPVNHGTYWSKNWCLSQANGEFVAFHDSDDISDPMRLQMQLGAMLDGRGVVATTCRWKRVSPGGSALKIDGKASRTAIISMMIRREELLSKIGYFDSVRIAADSEYHARIAAVFGYKQMRNMRHTLYTGLLREQSLTRGGQSGVNWNETGNDISRTIKGDRAEYIKAYQAWHKCTKPNLFIPFPNDERPFPAPSGICAGCDDMNTSCVHPVSGKQN